jgi:hypothetical protein
MPIKNDREYRNLGTFEIREEDDIKTVKGYASTFDTYELWNDGDLILHERIARDAFEGADMSDVVFLRDHTGAVLARTKNGSVKLTVDNRGLYTETDLSLTEASRNMYEDIQVGNYSQMSFSFVVAQDHIDWLDDRNAVRTIDKIKKLYDVSAVAFPANPYTDIGLSARSLFDGAIEQREAERLLREKAERKRKALQLRIRLMKGE